MNVFLATVSSHGLVVVVSKKQKHLQTLFDLMTLKLKFLTMPLHFAYMYERDGLQVNIC